MFELIMKMFFQFLKSKDFFKHLGIAILSIGIILFIIFKWLNVYTRHGETVTIPNLKGLEISEAMELLEEQGFRYVIDSIYTDKAEPGTVYEQEPEANSLVKENRNIYLTIVSSDAPSIKLPDLIDVSLREAQAILESYGISIKQLIYKPDLAQNAVLAIQYKGRILKKGDVLKKGDAVDLVLGDGYGNLKVNVPNLVGLTYDEALFVIQGSKLIVGAIIFDGGKTDTSKAIVYKQSPEFSTDTTLNQISQGETIDLYLKVQ